MQVYMELLNIENEEGPCTLDKLGACKTAHTTQKCKTLSYNDWTCWNNKRKEFIEFSLELYLNSQKWIFSSFYSGLTFLLIFV